MAKSEPTFDEQADAALSAHNRKLLKMSAQNYGKIAAESDEVMLAALIARGKTEEEARAILSIEKPKPAKPKKNEMMHAEMVEGHPFEDEMTNQTSGEQ